MNRALFAAATGMAAQQLNLDTIADNLANSDVSGFKSAAASFAELSAPDSRGLGTTSLGTHTVFTQGKLMKSGGPFDMAIDGLGFFAVSDAQGRRAYTRDGAFSRAPDGTLRNAAGWKLRGVRIPADAMAIELSGDGVVRAKTAKGAITCGRVTLSVFASPEHLQPLGNALFGATLQAGTVVQVHPGKEDAPQIKFGMLEQANVSIVEAMIQILTAQRAYEANAKGVQAADEMMRIANNLNRG